MMMSCYAGYKWRLYTEPKREKENGVLERGRILAVEIHVRNMSFVS